MDLRLPLLLPILLVGCAATTSFDIPPANAPPSAPMTGTIRFEPRFTSSGNSWFVKPKNRIVQSLIPGALFGGARGADWVFDVGGQPFDLDLDSFAEPVSRSARRLNYVDTVNGLRVIPADTRIASLVFFVDVWGRMTELEPAHVKPLAQTDLDAESLRLVYFDRPCRMYGSYYSSNGRIEIDVTIHAAGFGWIRLIHDTKTGERRIVSGDAFKQVVLTVPYPIPRRE